MKKISLMLTFTAAFLLKGLSQVTVDTTIKLDLLQSPASPAFNILGISLNDIEQPTDVSTFALSLQQATNNFTAIPNSYAFQLAPFLMAKKKYVLNSFDDGKNAFKQSFMISAGFTHMGPKGEEGVDSLRTTKIGLGIKFSIIRPKWTGQTRTAYTNLVTVQKQLLNDLRDAEKKQARFKELENKKNRLEELGNKDDLTNAEKQERANLINEIRELNEEIFENAKLEESSITDFDNAKRVALSFKTERKGVFLDFSGGAALDFPDNRFNNSKVYRAGMWLTGGYENGNKGFSFLGIARYLYNPESLFADAGGLLKGGNFSTFDLGARALVNTQEKFLFSTECIYRSVLHNNLVDPSWRLVLNAEYSFDANRKLTFAFGRDFDGTISKGGNLIAAINLIAGFGTNRKISD